MRIRSRQWNERLASYVGKVTSHTPVQVGVTVYGSPIYVEGAGQR